jgi:small subunit ribosomal protein S20
VPAPSKRDKQSAKRHEHTKAIRTRLKNLSRDFYRAMDAGDDDRARSLRDAAQKQYDKAAGKGVIHPNKASRKLGRFDKALSGSGSDS